MNYYISDLHFLHKNCIQFDERPFSDIEEMQRVMVEKWNRKITNGDTVYILGDVSMRGKKDDLIALVATLKGRKILVKGNHDSVEDYRYQQLYDTICDYKEVQDSVDGTNYSLVLCHYPIFSWKNMGRGTILLYGHTHNGKEDDYFQRCIAQMSENECGHIYDKMPRAYNVGCMKPWMNYEPRTLKEILENAGRN